MAPARRRSSADVGGDVLDGRNTYTIRFTVPPPVGAFWSLTTYDVPDYSLVDNPIDRYSIGGRTPGLSYAADNSLALLVQHEPPSDQDRSNWLPAPGAPFRLVLRLYQPGKAILDGTYDFPAIRKRVGEAR